MDTARAGVVLPGKHRKTIPWKQLGAHFAEHMPPEISTLVATVSVPSIAFDAEMAKRLDEDWKKNLAPVKVPTPSKDGESTTGDELGESVPASAERQAPQSTGGSRGKTRSAAEATGGGESPAKIKAKTLPPAVRFVDAHEAVSEIGITWLPSDNTVQISKGFAPYIREVGRWAEKTHHSRQVIENAVQLAYATEYAATIVDANGQAKHGADATTVEELKSDTALYTKALGMQAITERIEDLLRTAVKV